LTTSTTDHKAILEVDTIGSVRLPKVVGRSMLANHRDGVIINISSTPAMSGNFEGAPYTKAKVAGYGRRNIRAYTLMLGNIETESSYKFMTEEERVRGAQEAAMKRWGEVAKVAAYVASDSFSFATGNTITIGGGRCDVTAGVKM
jgi:3-oxoacyl-[acyl-carrier protein] reductase